MHSHPNARLTQRGRLRLVNQHLEHGRSLAELAAENGISLRCAYRWLARFRQGGPASLADRRSVRRGRGWDTPRDSRGSAARCSERLLNRIQRRIGIQAGISFSPKALQPLIDQLSISFGELRAHLLGSDRVPERLHQLQPLSQGQRQQVFHQVLCRPGPENSLVFTVARGLGRGTSGLPSSWLRRRLADQREEGLESGSVGFGWVEEYSGGKQSASIEASSCLPLAFSCLSCSVSFSICLIRSSLSILRCS